MIIKISKIDKKNNYFVYGGTKEQILNIKKNFNIKIFILIHTFHIQKFIKNY